MAGAAGGVVVEEYEHEDEREGEGGAEGGAEGGLHHQPCHQEGAQRLGASAASATQQPQVTDKDS